MPPEELTYRNSVQDKLDAILSQTKKTNGRVTALEDEAVVNEVFRARIYTAVGILTFLVGSVLVPIIGSFIATGRF